MIQSKYIALQNLLTTESVRFVAQFWQFINLCVCVCMYVCIYLKEKGSEKEAHYWTGHPLFKSSRKLMKKRTKNGITVMMMELLVQVDDCGLLMSCEGHLTVSVEVVLLSCDRINQFTSVVIISWGTLLLKQASGRGSNGEIAFQSIASSLRCVCCVDSFLIVSFTDNLVTSCYSIMPYKYQLYTAINSCGRCGRSRPPSSIDLA